MYLGHRLSFSLLSNSDFMQMLKYLIMLTGSGLTQGPARLFRLALNSLGSLG